MRVSDLDTALKGAHAHVSGAWEHALGQGVAAPISCEEAARSPRPPLFLPAGGLWVPSKSAKPAPADNERSFWVWLYFLFREYHIYIAHRLWRSGIGFGNKCGGAALPCRFHAAFDFVLSVGPDTPQTRNNKQETRNVQAPARMTVAVGAAAAEPLTAEEAVSAVAVGAGRRPQDQTSTPPTRNVSTTCRGEAAEPLHSTWRHCLLATSSAGNGGNGLDNGASDWRLRRRQH